MMNKIKAILAAAGIAVIFYFFGKRKGADDEKIRNLKAGQKNMARVLRAHAELDDPDFVRKLHDRYRRV
jgi:uroporphyrinogen-III synthase